MGSINVIKPLLSTALSSSTKQHKEFRKILGNPKNRTQSRWVRSENTIRSTVHPPQVYTSSDDMKRLTYKCTIHTAYVGSKAVGSCCPNHFRQVSGSTWLIHIQHYPAIRTLASSTWCSQAVSHPSNVQAQCYFTRLFDWELVQEGLIKRHSHLLNPFSLLQCFVLWKFTWAVPKASDESISAEIPQKIIFAWIILSNFFRLLKKKTKRRSSTSFRNKSFFFPLKKLFCRLSLKLKNFQVLSV